MKITYTSFAPREGELDVVANDHYSVTCPVCGMTSQIDIQTLEVDAQVDCKCGQKIHASLP